MLQFAYPIYIEEMHFYRTAWVRKGTVFPSISGAFLAYFAAYFWCE